MHGWWPPAWIIKLTWIDTALIHAEYACEFVYAHWKCLMVVTVVTSFVAGYIHGRL